MGMDGISIANTGIIKEQTSAEITNRAEQAINSDPANSSRQVQGTSTNQRVREKEEDEENKEGRKGRGQNLEDTFEDGLVEEENDSEDENDIEEIDAEDIENSDKEFYVKLNVKDDIIELYDSTNERLIETISGDELGELVQKLNMASGIFVNKKV
ncbi:hypothetical protein IJ750_04700 [bacterium]|nr:hypothetical protein [bacterium]